MDHITSGMREFAFTVTDQEGARTSGTVIATDQEAAIRLLAQRNFVVTRIKPAASLRQSVLDRIGLKRPSMNGEQLVAFTQQLSAMLDAGVTLKSALSTMSMDTADVATRRIMQEISRRLGEGCSLAESLSCFPGIFNEQYIAMVEAGETSGRLPTILGRLAGMLERSREMRKKVEAALYYPMLVLAFTAAIVVGIFVFAVPRFEEIYRGLGGELPWATRLFLNAGTFVSTHWMLLVGALGLAAWLGVRWAHSMSGRRKIDRLSLRLWPMATLFRKLAIARFARTLSSLHGSGVPIVPSLQLVARSIGNRELEHTLLVSLRQVEQGESLGDMLRRVGLFTEMSMSMISVGENAGSLDLMLDKLAHFYETEVEIALKGLTSMLEPVIMIVVGGVVGAIVTVMVLPIFRMATLLFDK